ncbi:MAG: rubrerythrin family protein [Sphingobacteriales bacterium 50-39]|nr:ferritin-like domain-containing protein [Sphingobacteriales bacterium]OJW61178.1 MAG: rubrerythrin family protein [Sphingobacteriales bacterium 50-39]
MATKQPQTGSARNSKLQEFFVEQLQDIYWAEQKLVKTLPKLEEAASSGELKQAFNSHLQETKNHVSRLEKIFEMVGEPAEAKKCHAIAGIADEGEEIIDQTEENTAQRDVGLIFAGQKAEHYEIATYGGLVTLARTLGYGDAAEILSVTLSEEKNADSKLTSIAEGGINVKAKEEVQEA